MKILLKKGLVLMLVLTMLVSFAGCGASNNEGGEDAGEAKTYSFTLSCDTPEDSVTYLYAQKFKEELEAATGGKATLQIFANGTMGSDVEATESCLNGEIDFVALTTAPMVNFIPELAVFDMPSVFENIEIARKAVDSEFFNQLEGIYEGYGFKILGFADQGFRQMSSNKMVTSMADFEGQKIRTMENPYHIAYWRAIGANPTPMAFSEVYIGLQQGTIDAQENPYETIVAAKLYEQQKYIINTNHVIHLVSLVTNLNKFNSLPEDIQTAIVESAQTAKVWAREQADERIGQRVEIMESNDTEIIELSPELKKEMKEAAAPVYDMIREKIGDELVDSLLDATK
ncbi:tripartite ATP-independent transporter solute receptor, DctP family [Dethiosulfatibacter aminovorans DSM 17477]|uniref:Tripartite ATP-independent transporter solute receptor, DctP family n=1 Tax=Dethiosulfatibacter aminovorans DSM 17477 TaxID=1121476 RepID=A0A1M6AIQ9_9FIRM|nr:TRAP transporter substrate-binding protein [Dethiosulfatibacter aminovorans]SHI36370.1 tripartite ATP-independent transporter solute receptor, DctP family [Dethiosulfatibacter aminovorans DSM 17477]